MEFEMIRMKKGLKW